MADCRADCRTTPPFDRRTQAQIGAFTGSAAIIGVLATNGKPTLTRAAIAAGAAAFAAAASTSYAAYVQRKRCEAICEALNRLAAGQKVLVDWWLSTALAHFLEGLSGPCPKPPFKSADEEWQALLCLAADRLVPILREAEASRASSGETWTKR